MQKKVANKIKFKINSNEIFLTNANNLNTQKLYIYLIHSIHLEKNKIKKELKKHRKMKLSLKHFS